MKLIELLKDKEQREQCRHVNPHDSIFVSYVTVRPFDAEKTIRQLMNNSYCSKRIRIGLLEYVEPETYNQPMHHNQRFDRMFLKGVSHTTENLLGKKFMNKYRSQITVHTKHLSESKGQCYGRSYIEQKIYHGQQYFMMIEDGVRLPKNWDLYLVTRMKELNNPWFILTQPPKQKIWDGGESISALMKKRKVVSSKNVGQWSCVANVFSNYSPSPSVPVIGPTFTTVHDRYNRHPYFKYLPNVDTFSTNAVWCPQFSFMSSFVIKQCPHPTDMIYMKNGYDWYMSIRYWTSGFQFVVPPGFSVEQKLKTEIACPWDYSKSIETYSKFYSTAVGPQRSLDNYYQWLGLSQSWKSNDDADQHCFLGVPVYENSKEIVSKFGSLYIFQQFLN
jgi:hypothetical protein